MISCLGCTHEGPHQGCGGVNLIFRHDGSIEEFDRLIASDIELYLYDSEGEIIEKKHISYQEIKGGRPYTLERQYDGKVHIVAWAVPDEEDKDKLPISYLGEDDYSAAKFTMGELSSTRQSRVCAGASQELYLGCLDFSQNSSGEITLNVDVNEHLCSVTVRIEDGTDFKTLYPGELTLDIYGSSYSYNVATGKQCGTRVVVKDEFFYLENKNEYVSNNMIMPASFDPVTGEEENIVVTVFEDGVARFMVDTGIKAQKGMQIDVVIEPTKLQALITVDSWQVRKALVVL